MASYNSDSEDAITRSPIEVVNFDNTDFVAVTPPTSESFSPPNSYATCDICRGYGCTQCFGGQKKVGSEDPYLREEQGYCTSPEHDEELISSPSYSKYSSGSRKHQRQSPQKEQRETRQRVERETGRSRDCYWMDEREPSESKEEAAAHFYPITDPWTRQLDELCRISKDGGLCFACVYDAYGGHSQPSPVFRNNWNSFLKEVMDGLANVAQGSIKTLAEELYDTFLDKVLAKQKVKNKVTGIVSVVRSDTDPWSPASIIEHFQYHTTDPQIVAHRLIIERIDQLRTVQQSQMYLKHDISGRVIISEAAVDLQGKLQKQLIELYKLEPAKLYTANHNRKLPDVVPMLNPKRKVVTQSVENQIFRSK